MELVGCEDVEAGSYEVFSFVAVHAAVHKRTVQKVANLIEYIILSAGHIVGGVATVNIKHLSVMVITDDLGSSDVGSIPTGAVNTEMCNLFQS